MRQTIVLLVTVFAISGCGGVTDGFDDASFSDGCVEILSEVELTSVDALLLGVGSKTTPVEACRNLRTPYWLADCSTEAALDHIRLFVDDRAELPQFSSHVEDYCDGYPSTHDRLLSSPTTIPDDYEIGACVNFDGDTVWVTRVCSLADGEIVATAVTPETCPTETQWTVERADGTYACISEVQNQLEPESGFTDDG